MSYILFPHVRVQNANIATTSFLIGGAPIMAAYGLGCALCHALKGGARIGGVALIHHSRQDLGEKFYGKFHPQQRRAASYSYDQKAPTNDYVGSSLSLSLQPVACAHMTASIVWQVQNVVDLTAARAFLEQCRLAGGTVVGHGPIEFLDDIATAFSRLKSGYVLLDRRDIMKEASSAKNHAQALVEALGTIHPGEEDKAWLSAACVGYAAISELAPRPGAREGYDHAFAEPLVGLVQYKSLRQMRQEASDMDMALWKPHWDNDNFCLYQ